MMAGALVTCAAAAGGAAVFLFSGIYSVAASTDHTRVVYWALEQGMRSSVRAQAADVPAPPPMDAAMLRKGAHCFHENCVQCHGAPGHAPADFAGGLLPVAKSLVQTSRELPLEQVYWITRHGIRLTAMPAWEHRLDDRDLWAIAAFVHRELPRLSVQQYRQAVAASAPEVCARPSARSTPEPKRGLSAMRQYGCQGCHIIPGITGPTMHVGPSLREFARRPLIAGALPNTPENVLRWLQQPQSLRPRTLMPHLGVTEQHALDMRAYLATLR